MVGRVSGFLRLARMGGFKKHLAFLDILDIQGWGESKGSAPFGRSAGDEDRLRVWWHVFFLSFSAGASPVQKLRFCAVVALLSEFSLVSLDLTSCSLLLSRSRMRKSEQAREKAKNDGRQLKGGREGVVWHIPRDTVTWLV